MQVIAFLFDDFRLDLRARTLHRAGEIIPLTPKEFDALVVFLENPGKEVEKETLIGRLWGIGTHVDGGALARHISSLRKKLGERADGQSYIKPLSGRGYHFFAAVREEMLPLPTHPNVVIPKRRTSPKLLLKIAIPVCIAVTIAGSILLLHRPVPQRPSVAVLRFQDRSMVTDQRWLSVALPEMLRSELGATGAVRLISGEDVSRMETELRLPRADTLSAETLSQVRQNIAADYVVTGLYTILPGTRDIRIDIALQDAKGSTPARSEAEHGPMTNLFEMVASTGSALRADLGIGGVSHSELASLRETLPSNPESAQLFAEGLSEFRASNFLQARDLLTRASERDPDSLSIRSALGEVWARLGYERRARENACKAIERAPGGSRENQLLLEGRCRELSHDWVRAVEVYQSLWTFFPDEPEHGLRLVRADVAAGRSQDALRIVTQLQKSRAAADDPRVDLSIAETAEAQGDFAKELAAAESAINKGSKRGAPLLVARAQLRAAWALDYLGNRPRALEMARTARETFTRLNDKGGEAIAIKNIADVIDDGNDHAKALPIYTQALMRFRDIGSTTGIIVTLNNMGYALKDMGDLKGAEARFAESIHSAQEISDGQREAQALNSLAGVYWRRGDLPEAETTFDAAESKFEAAGDRSRAATAIGNLGLVLKDAGDLTAAEKKLDRSFDMSHETSDQVGMARTSGNQGDLYVMLGRLGDARRKYSRQLSIADRINDDKQRGYALFGMGRLTLIEGKAAEAKNLLKQSLELRSKHGEVGLVAESRLILAEAEIESGDSAGVSEAQSAAKQFRSEGEYDQEAKAIGLLLRNSLETTYTLADCELHFRRLQELLPTLKSHEARGVALVAVARYLAARGSDHEAAETLRNANREAEESGDVELQLETELVTAEVGRDATAVEQMQQKFKAKGFNLLAIQAERYRSRSLNVPHR